MDRTEAMARLPDAYRVVLTLVDENLAPTEIASRAAVALDALPALIEIAESKLRRLMAEPLEPRSAK